MLKQLRLLLLPLATCVAAAAFAQQAATTNMEILKQKIKADKKLVVAANMSLTEVEARNFWPAYDAYQKDLEQINQRLVKVITAYADAYNKGPVTDDTAKKLLNEALAIEDAEIKLKRSYAAKLDKTIPAAKIARYIQIENKVRAIIRYELAAGIPLVE